MAASSTSVADAKVVGREPLDAENARWTKLVLIHYTDPSSRPRTWESAERLTRPSTSPVDAVGIVAILNGPRGPEILLQKQFRPPLGKVCIEVPAGLVDQGEGVEEAAIRELREETGYEGIVEGVVDGVVGGEEGSGATFVMYNDPGFTNTNVQMVHMRVEEGDDGEAPKQRLEEGEFIETFRVRLEDLYEVCMKFEGEGYAIDARVGGLAEGIEVARRWKLFSG